MTFTQVRVDASRRLNDKIETRKWNCNKKKSFRKLEKIVFLYINYMLSSLTLISNNLYVIKHTTCLSFRLLSNFGTFFSFCTIKGHRSNRDELVNCWWSCKTTKHISCFQVRMLDHPLILPHIKIWKWISHTAKNSSMR